MGDNKEYYNYLDVMSRSTRDYNQLLDLLSERFFLDVEKARKILSGWNYENEDRPNTTQS